ncbi:MAG: glucose-1-phosphate cytidylyltransferase [Pirellulales bacterium]
MKVVLFCGGMGMRLREYSESIPKPMVNIGCRPILWHIMKYYSHFGHKDFILCLGWKGNVIKDYFLNYQETVSNDFVMSSGGAVVDLLNCDIHDWNITFVDTRPTSSIGERLRAVRNHVEGEGAFLANYTDGLTDLHLPKLIDFFYDRNAAAAFLSVPPTHSFHMVTPDHDGRVACLQAISDSGVWMNGGYFVLSEEIFEYLDEGEDLVAEPFQRLIADGKLYSLQHPGFWSCMDTYKEKQCLEDMYLRGDTPWEISKHSVAHDGLASAHSVNGNARPH